MYFYDHCSIQEWVIIMEKYNFNWLFSQRLDIKCIFYFLMPKHLHIKDIQLWLCILDLFLKTARYFYKTNLQNYLYLSARSLFWLLLINIKSEPFLCIYLTSLVPVWLTLAVIFRTENCYAVTCLVYIMFILKTE